jgi:hypothetical protein
VPAENKFPTLPDALLDLPRFPGTAGGLPGRFESHVSNCARWVGVDCEPCEQVCQQYPKSSLVRRIPLYRSALNVELGGPSAVGLAACSCSGSQNGAHDPRSTTTPIRAQCEFRPLGCLRNRSYRRMRKADWSALDSVLWGDVAAAETETDNSG